MEKDIKSLPVLRFSGNLKYNIKDFVHVKKYDELELLKINTLCERYCQKNEDKLLAWRAISPPPQMYLRFITPIIQRTQLTHQ